MDNNTNIVLIEDYFNLKKQVEELQKENQEIKKTIRQLQPSTVSKIITNYNHLQDGIKIITLAIMFVASHNPIFLINLCKLFFYYK